MTVDEFIGMLREECPDGWYSEEDGRLRRRSPFDDQLIECPVVALANCREQHARFSEELFDEAGDSLELNYQAYILIVDAADGIKGDKRCLAFSLNANKMLDVRARLSSLLAEKKEAEETETPELAAV